MPFTMKNITLKKRRNKIINKRRDQNALKQTMKLWRRLSKNYYRISVDKVLVKENHDIVGRISANITDHTPLNVS